VLLHRFLADEDAQGKILTFLLSRRRFSGKPVSAGKSGGVRTSDTAATSSTVQSSGTATMSGSAAAPGAAGFSIERTCVRLTQNDLADSVGLSRETVNRQLKLLERLGLIIVGRGEVAIPDWENLASFASSRSR
jgi:CRP-like cAMP-binding protein